MSRNRVKVTYQFENLQPTMVEVWCALPPTLPAQTDVALEWTATPPDLISETELNRIAYFRVQPGARIAFTAHANLHIVNQLPRDVNRLSPQDRDLYLRSTTLCAITDDVRAMALRVTAGAKDDYERVRQLYTHLLNTMKYRWPPPDRGSASALQNSVGDCGDYSMLFAAACRSLGLPCRTIVGTWAFGKTQAHVWNEVFLDDRGWLLVDTSGDQLQINLPLPGFVKRALIERLATRVGQHGGSRFAFSIDPDVVLSPPFEPTAVVPADAVRLGVGGTQLAWGYELLSGRAPYMQPVYIRLDSSQPFNEKQEPLGVWEVTVVEEGRFRLVALFAGLALGAVCAIMMFITSAPGWMRVVVSIAFLLATILGPLRLRNAAAAALITFLLAQFATRIFAR